MDKFVEAVQEVFPKCCIHFEDWTGVDAVHLLQRYRDKYCVYNDDVQGTAGITLKWFNKPGHLVKDVKCHNEVSGFIEQLQGPPQSLYRNFPIEGVKPKRKKIGEYVESSLMLVTALSPVIGYDKASQIAHYAMDNDLTLKAAALKLGFVSEADFDRIVDPAKMVKPYVASEK